MHKSTFYKKSVQKIALDLYMGQELRSKKDQDKFFMKP